MHRLFLPPAVLLAAVSTVVGLPVASPAGPDARPVTPVVADLALGGVDAAALAEQPDRGRPVVLTGRRGTDRFTTLGVTWAARSAAAGTSVQVRTRTGGRWSAWTSLDVSGDEAPDAQSGEAVGAREGTGPLFVEPSDGVQIRIDAASGRPPRDLRLALIDPGTSPADAVLTPRAPRDSAAATTPEPVVISRAAWGADESLRSAEPAYASTLRAAYVHHTASTNTYTPEQAAAQVRGFYAYHTQSLGWSDIAYNFLVDKYGRVYEGRAGGIDRPVVGSHAGGFNTGTVGVAMIGDHTSVAPTAATVEAVSRVIAYKLSLHGRDPRGTAVLTSGGGSTSKYPAGAQVTVDTVTAHRVTNNTACPGDAGYAQLPTIRSRVAAVVAQEDRDPIDAKHAALGGDAGLLGPATASSTTVTGGRMRTYRNGWILWGAETLAHAVRGSVLDKYAGLGGPGSTLGLPRTDEVLVPGGRASTFQGGAVSWSPSTGAQAVAGSIFGKWAALRREGGPLRLPLTDERATPDGRGRYNQFQGGSVYWSPTTPASAVQGSIRDRWSALRWEAGPLGYPVTDELVPPDGRGRYNHFQGGSVYWSPETPALDVQGAIRDRWARLGWERGLGYPTSGETVAPDRVGRTSSFQGGSIWWSPSTGAFEVVGVIARRWAAEGGASGRLGYPVSGEYDVQGGRRSDFQRGAIVWDRATGAAAVVSA